MGIDLTDRTAVVTGGAAGIGRGIAIELAREGADIVVADLDDEPTLPEEKERGTTVEVVEEMGHEAEFVKTDVTDENQVSSLMDVAAEEFAGIDILVNNAGIAGRGKASETTLEFWNKVLAVNLTGPFLCAKHAIPYLVESDQGRIINISSQGSKRASGTNTAYCISKAGISHLTRSLAAELGSEGVNVNGIMPGPVRTEMMADVLDDPEQRQTYLDQMCVDYYGVPEDIGRVAVFLASEDSRYVTGHEVAAEGGWLVN
ncbi:SDR family NAD(P)-dependent oxidoreductase [Natronosalvus rutilus]|uniref:SDR family oxidoreductase n=1 Tax=Natronosalvus rutilus TaxID=2953753 RepID=A0A9E7NET3_9EURY|nr:SDR family oxidoreductase [Natronosalvus rutilus]UTF55685.1 SDR family oxidoreductase [Natronosalvus rutilus]